jgi:hypothetical protein
MTIDQLIGKIEKLRSLLERTPNKLLITPTRGLESIVKERIFINGIGSDSKVIGTGYSNRWKAARESKGLQTKYVDLKFTGSLRKNLTTRVEDSATVVMTIDSDFDYNEKAIYQEKFRKMSIFALSDKETKTLGEFVEMVLDFQIEKALA